MDGTVVVLGGGQAGAQVAASLRENGWTGRVILTGDEPHLPYQRPPLSKAHLKGEMKAERLSFWPAGFYADRSIELKLGSPGARIDLTPRRVTLASGEEIGFDKLVLATGTRARTPPFAGVALDRALSLRGIADVERLRLQLDAVERAVIVGGGYIGLEVAAVLREMGRHVTIVEAEDRLLKRVAAAPTGRYFEALHLRNGVEVLTGARIAELSGETRTTGVVLTDGRRIDADLVLLAVGAVANTEIAEAAAIDCRDGILVDAFGRTSAEGVYACGDCARFPSRRFARSVRLESVHNAIEQAKAVATTIAGTPRAHDPVPWFWSDQYRTKLQIAGLSDPDDQVTTDGDAHDGPFAVEYRRHGRLVAVDSIDNGRGHMLARRRIAEATEANAASGEPSPHNDRRSSESVGAKETSVSLPRIRGSEGEPARQDADARH